MFNIMIQLMIPSHYPLADLLTFISLIICTYREMFSYIYYDKYHLILPAAVPLLHPHRPLHAAGRHRAEARHRSSQAAHQGPQRTRLPVS